MCSGDPSSPKVQKAPVAPPIVPPLEADETAKAAGDLERKRRQAASGRSDTLLSGGNLGLAPVGGKTALGQ